MNRYEVGVMTASLEASYEYYFGPRTPPMTPDEIRKTLPFRAFHNALRILHSLDYYEVSFLNDHDWDMFRAEPYDFFITTTDEHAALIWAAIQKRQPKELKSDV